MTDTKTIEVTGCQDCPFGYNDPFIVFCQHPGVDCKSMDLDDDANVITSQSRINHHKNER